MKFIKKSNEKVPNTDLTSKNFNNLNVVCLSNQTWDFKLWTNKKHIMSELRDRYVPVLFIDPPLRLKIFNKIIKNIITLKQIFVPIVESKTLKIYSPFRFSLSKNIGRFIPILDDIYIYYTAYIINNFLDNLEGKKVLWIYHVSFPGLEKLLKLIKVDLIIYDLVDDYSEMPEFSKVQEWLKQRENWLIKKADVVFTSAPGLFNKYFSMKKGDVYYIPNAGAFDLFNKTENLLPPEKLKEILAQKKKIVGFSGTLDAYKVNVPLVKRMVQTYPNYNFVFIGPINLSDYSEEFENLRNFHNVYFIDPVPKPDLVAFHKYFDVYIIPYNLNSYTKGCFPVKFFDALSSGLAVVSTNLQAFEPFSQVCYIAKSDGEFINLLKVAIDENSEVKKNERIKVASLNTWDQKLDKQLEIICRY